jgi:tetratricopeptide (TPR) repeat protein
MPRLQLLVLCLALCSALPLQAQEEIPPERVEAAKKLYVDATAAYDAERFAEALALFERAYESAPLAGFLFNIGQCHRQLGDDHAALDHYRRYLAADPEAGNREEVEGMIEVLEATMPEPPEPSSASAAPTETDPAGADDTVMLAAAGGAAAATVVVLLVVGTVIAVVAATGPSLGRVDLREPAG